jgi:hypothetical protein
LLLVEVKGATTESAAARETAVQNALALAITGSLPAAD